MTNDREGFENLSAEEAAAWREYDARQQEVTSEYEARMLAEFMDEGRPTDVDVPVPVVPAMEEDSLVGKYAELERMPGYEPTSWRPISALSYYDRDPEPPVILPREDGVCLLYPGMSHSFIGHFESLKSWAALLAVKDVVMRRGGTAFYVDMESGPYQFFRRVKQMGIPLDRTLSHIAYFAPREQLYNPRIAARTADTSARRDFFVAGGHYEPELIVIDGVTEYMAMHGLDIAEATDIALYQRMFLKGWTGQITTLEVDHVAKNTNEREFKTALGSQHKEAGIDGAVYYFQSVQKGGAHRQARADIYVIKDREGFLNDVAVGDHRMVGTFVLDGDGARIEPAVELTIGQGLAAFQDDAVDFEQQVLQRVAQYNGKRSKRQYQKGEFPNRSKSEIGRTLDDLEQAMLIRKNDQGNYELYGGFGAEDG